MSYFKVPFHHFHRTTDDKISQDSMYLCARFKPKYKSGKLELSQHNGNCMQIYITQLTN
jgi:hypothetical protein